MIAKPRAHRNLKWKHETPDCAVCYADKVIQIELNTQEGILGFVLDKSKSQEQCGDNTNRKYPPETESAGVRRIHALRKEQINTDTKYGKRIRHFLRTQRGHECCASENKKSPLSPANVRGKRQSARDVEHTAQYIRTCSQPP